MFKNVLVRIPCKRMTEGISTAGLGLPDYQKALAQHLAYIEALKSCGIKVTILEADENYPDSTFVEDTAVLTEKCAVITNPGAQSRKGEELKVYEALKEFYANFEYIKAPGTLEGGDIMRVGDHFYIGLSNRTNQEGAKQLIEILNKYGYTGSVVKLSKILHLKTGLSYIENNNLLISGEFLENPEFDKFNKIEISDEENYSSNCIWVNDYVLIPMGFPHAKAAILKAGYKIKELDVSEFRKIDGGLSCLSLRF